MKNVKAETILQLRTGEFIPKELLLRNSAQDAKNTRLINRRDRFCRLVAQWVEHRSPKPGVAGSSPA